jgi:hypothetical protein
MNFSENSRVWIYQANRAFTAAEGCRLNDMLTGFTESWAAHGNLLAAGFEIRYSRFIILFVDEHRAGASGCSIDKSVSQMKAIEQEFGVTLFDRFDIAYKEGNEVVSVNRAQFEEMVRSARVNANTIVFNNLVQTKKELDTRWEIPFAESWHPRVFS